MADGKAVTIRTRKFMTNRLLSRKQFVSTLPFLISFHRRAKKNKKKKNFHWINLFYFDILVCIGNWCAPSWQGQCFQGRFEGVSFFFCFNPFVFQFFVFWVSFCGFWRRSWKRNCQRCMKWKTQIPFLCSSSAPILVGGSLQDLGWSMILLRTPRSLSPNTGLSGWVGFTFSFFFFFPSYVILVVVWNVVSSNCLFYVTGSIVWIIFSIIKRASVCFNRF